MRLNKAALARLSGSVRRPSFDPATVKCGIVHLGIGAFHRAHQAVYTDAAIAAAGGDWGIVGVSMRKPDVAEALAPQDGLYTVELLDAQPSYRVVGAVRRALTLPAATSDRLQCQDEKNPARRMHPGNSLSPTMSG